MEKLLDIDIDFGDRDHNDLYKLFQMGLWDTYFILFPPAEKYARSGWASAESCWGKYFQ